jgi:hypothetical protein
LHLLQLILRRQSFRLLQLILRRQGFHLLLLILRWQGLHLLLLILRWQGLHLLLLILSPIDLRLQWVNASSVTGAAGQDKMPQALWSLANLAAGRNLNKDYLLYFTSDVKNQRRGANG